MAWTNSKVFAFYVLGIGTNTRKLSTDTYSCALFKTTVVPTNKYGTATKAKTEYEGTGSTWSATNQSSGTGYTAGGKALTSVTWTQATNVLHFKAANLTWTTVTVTAYGDLVYDTTTGHTNSGLCYNYFGGQFTSSGGTFTVTWSATGIFKVTC